MTSGPPAARRTLLRIAGAVGLGVLAGCTSRTEKVASITSLELYEGVGRSRKPEAEKRKVLSVLDSKHVIPADHGVMRRAGELSGRLIEDGEPIDREDCIIAATAIQENEPVLTRNDSHFGRIPNLDVETY